jgi:hypothetical protein
LLVSQSVGFEAYVYFQAIKRHFTSNYDYFKYHGKMNLKKSSFEKKRDRYQYAKLLKTSDWEELVLSNIVSNPNIWVGDLFSEEAKIVYYDWKKVNNSLTYTFKSDINRFDDDLSNTFKVKNGRYPLPIDLYQKGEIHLETLVLLNRLFKCFDYWDSKVEDLILYPLLSQKARKYEPFVKYKDTQKLIQTIQSKYNVHIKGQKTHGI